MEGVLNIAGYITVIGRGDSIDQAALDDDKAVLELLRLISVPESVRPYWDVRSELRSHEELLYRQIKIDSLLKYIHGQPEAELRIYK